MVVYIYDEEAAHIDEITKILSDVYSSAQYKYRSKTEMHEEKSELMYISKGIQDVDAGRI